MQRNTHGTAGIRSHEHPLAARFAARRGIAAPAGTGQIRSPFKPGTHCLQLNTCGAKVSPRPMAKTYDGTKGVWIGTSGWTYDGWRGPFYPSDVPKKEWLAWYATRFASTEINFSFYRTPSLEAVRAWRDQTPADFLFAWKASKFITHWKRLNEHTCQNSLDLMATRLKALGRKAGPVLFQLPPQFEADQDRLANFLRMLPRRYLYAFEFRHPSWHGRDIIQLLRQHNVSLLPLGSSSRACAVDCHRHPRLHPGPWTRRPLQEQLSGRH